MMFSVTRVAKQYKTEDLRNVETIKRISELDGYTIECPASPREMNFWEWRSKINARVDIFFFCFTSVFLYSLPNNCKECRYVIARSSQCKLLKYSRSKISLHAAKFYEAKFNSFCMCKLLMKINIGTTLFGEKAIYKLLCFRKPHVLSRLFIRNFFW